MNILNAVKPQLYKMVMGKIAELTPDQFESVLAVAAGLIDSRLAGDPARCAMLLNALDIDSEVRHFLAAVLWSHYAGDTDE